MEKREKIDAAVALLVARGMKKGKAFPLAWYLLRLLGVHLRPPVFMDRAKLMIIFSLYFSAIWGALVHLTVSLNEAGRIELTILGGLAFGIFMAVYYGRLARQMTLPYWRDI